MRATNPSRINITSSRKKRLFPDSVRGCGYLWPSNSHRSRYTCTKRFSLFLSFLRLFHCFQNVFPNQNPFLTKSWFHYSHRIPHILHNFDWNCSSCSLHHSGNHAKKTLFTKTKAKKLLSQPNWVWSNSRRFLFSAVLRVV